MLTLVLGVVMDLSLGEYLLRLGVPALPALLDVLDVATGNARVATTKVRLEERAESLIAQAETVGTPPTAAECRELQDGIYATRLVPSVPNWLYSLTRAHRQSNMDDSVRAQIDRLPSALR